MSDGEVGESVKTGGATGEKQPEQGDIPSQRDRARGGRGPASTLLLAKTGLAVPGAPSMYAAAIEGGYKPSTARNATQNGITVPRALAAAAELFPGTSIVANLKAKSFKAVDEALEDPETPKFQRSQTAIAFLKHAADSGEGDDDTEPTHSDAFYRRARRRAYDRVWMMALRYMEQHGLEAALEHRVALSERTDERVPLRDAMLPPRGSREPLKVVFHGTMK